MRDHYGYIDIRRGAKGSIFELYFTVIAQQELPVQQSTSLETIFGHGKTIHIVDDEKEQRDIIRSVLNRLGYQTATAASG